MESQIPSMNLSKLCSSIIDGVDRKEDGNAGNMVHCIDGLRYLCHGKLNERDCFSYLSPDEKLISLIVVADRCGILEKNPNVCSDTIHTLLNCPYLSNEICKGLRILFSTSFRINTNKRFIIEKIFSHKDFASVSMELLVDLLTFDPSTLQVYLLKLFLDVHHQSWDSQSTRHWISWCCRSPILFCKICSLMNQTLLMLKNKDNIINIIYSFIENVRQYCDRNGLDFVSLYPMKLQPLVSLMCLDIALFPANLASALIDNVSGGINLLKKESPEEAVILLTHFVNWQKVVF